MKHSLFTKLMSLFLAFALLVPCFPFASAAEMTEPTEVFESADFTEPEASDTIETTAAVETTEASPTVETTEAPVVTEATEETVPQETTAPVEETVPVDETVPVEVTVPTEETVPAEETDPTEETVPAEETNPTEETAPTEETVPEEAIFVPLGMPENYDLGEENEKDRLETLDHGIYTALDTMTPGVDYAYGEILVLAESEEEAQLMAAAYCGTLEHYEDGLATILLGEATVPQAVKASLSGEYNLPVASPNYIMRVEPMRTTPTTPYAMQTPQEMDWNDWVNIVMDDPDPALMYPGYLDYQYHHDVIDTYAAWGVNIGSSSVTVAVIDTGVDGSHPDLNVTQYTVSGIGLTGDSDGHGTHVCGIIAATMNNGFGGAGIAPYINLTSYRVTDSNNVMSDDAIYYAIRQAARNGANIINMSLGGYFYSSVLQSAIDYATDYYGVTIVAAMGNDGTNIKCYPAACDNVIAVGATDMANRRAWFSNYGDWCDISAPGVDIFSTYPDSNLAWMSGTSQATPVVSGAIALYMSFNFNNTDPASVAKALKASATKCADKGMGAGIVNVAKMIDDKPRVPGFYLQYNDSIIYDDNTYNGQTVPYNTEIILASYIHDQNWYYVYTLDGKTPSVKNGEVVYGTVGDLINLSPYAGTTVTLKAMQVSGMGIPGKVLTKKIKVGENTSISSISITGPSTIVAGKSGMFSATVNPVDTACQDVMWSISSWSDYSLASCKISQKGILTTPKNGYGTVTVRASSMVNSGKTATFTVRVQPLLPVTKVTLSHTKASLFVGRSMTLSATMTDKYGSTVTTAGKLWTSSDPGIATVNSNGRVTAISKGKVTITCKALDGSNKTAKCTLTVNQQVTGITITGNTAIAPGGSTTLKTVISPTNATTKKVYWTLDSAPAGVTISTSGKLKVPSYIYSGSITVRATAQDGMGAYDTHTLTIQQKVSGMILEPRSSYNGWAQGFTYKNGKLSTVNLFSVDMNDSSGQDNYCALKSTTYGASVGITWSSSNPAVASVSGNGYITAHKAGTAKITCTPLDGSKKSASVTIKVTNPVSYMEIKTSAPQMTNSIPYIGFGKSVTNSVVFGDTFGAPSNKKVVWDYEVYRYNSSNDTSVDMTSTFKNNKLVTVSSSGKVTVSKNAQSYWAQIPSSCEFLLYLYAYSTDGSRAGAEKQFMLIPPCSKIEMIEGTKYTAGRNNIYTVHFGSNQWHSFGDEYNCGFVVTSSNPKVCGGITVIPCDHYYSDYMNCYDVVFATGNQKGSAKITIKATDGSNKSCSFTVTVK